MSATEVEKKKRKPIKKDLYYLAICTGDGFKNIDKEITENGKTIYVPGDIFYTRKSALNLAKKIPDFLEANEVHIISASERLMVTRRTTVKVTV